MYVVDMMRPNDINGVYYYVHIFEKYRPYVETIGNTLDMFCVGLRGYSFTRVPFLYLCRCVYLHDAYMMRSWNWSGCLDCYGAKC